jgi:beta-carotene hydroxylase
MDARTGDATMARTLAGPQPPALALVGAAAAIVAAIVAVSLLALAGGIPLWAAGAFNVCGIYLYAHINHEAVHSNINGTASGLKWLNEAIGHFGSFWLFLPFPAFRAVHLAHHRMTNHKELDGDMWMAGKDPLDTLLRCSTLLVGYEIRMRRLAQRKLIEMSTVRAATAQRVLAAAMIAAAFLAGYGVEVMALWVIPSLVAMPILAFMFAYIVHRPHESEERYRSARVIRSGGALGKALCAAFVGQNYHLVHHLYPRAPFYRYAKLYRAIEGDLKAHGAPVTELV